MILMILTLMMMTLTLLTLRIMKSLTGPPVQTLRSRLMIEIIFMAISIISVHQLGRGEVSPKLFLAGIDAHLDLHI